MGRCRNHLAALMPPCPLPVWPSYRPAPPPQPVCLQSSCCNQNVIFPPLPPGSVQSSFQRLRFGAGISIFGKEHHQSTWDVPGNDHQCRAESYPPWEPSPGHHAPEVGPWRLRVFTWTLKIIIQPFLSTPRKNHPGHLLNQFPSPTTDLGNQYLQGPGEPGVEGALEILLSSFGKHRPNSAFTDVEPRSRAGSSSGVTQESRAASYAIHCMSLLQPGL